MIFTGRAAYSSRSNGMVQLACVTKSAQGARKTIFGVELALDGEVQNIQEKPTKCGTKVAGVLDKFFG